MKNKLKRLNVNMPVELVEEIDDYAETMGVNRTTAINLLCRLQLKQYQYRYTDDNGNAIEKDQAIFQLIKHIQEGK